MLILRMFLLLVKEDHEIRKYLNKVYVDAEVSLTEIERVKAKSKDRIKLTFIYSKTRYGYWS